LVTLIAQVSFQWLPWMTPARWFYVLRGVEGAALFLLLPYLAQSRPTRKQMTALAMVTLFGATSEALTAICGAAFYWGKGPLPVKAGGLMCDAAHPQLVAWMTISFCAAVLWGIKGERRHSS
jgi:hypothetical protein